MGLFCGLSLDLSCCFGGHGSVPWEQNTQQSPRSGFTITRHDGLSQTYPQHSTGIISMDFVPQRGDVLS